MAEWRTRRSGLLAGDILSTACGALSNVVDSMNQDQFRMASCIRKVRYGHQKTAHKAVAAMSKKGNCGLSSYHCELCGGWHVGHKMSAYTVVLRLEDLGERATVARRSRLDRNCRGVTCQALIEGAARSKSKQVVKSALWQIVQA